MKYVTLLLIIPVVQCGYLSRATDDFSGGIGGKCEYDDDCITTHAYCKNNRICACKKRYDYDQQNDMCFPLEVGLKCREDYDCLSLKNTRCYDNYCQCKDGYVALKENTACLPSSRLMATCSEDSQCLPSDANSHCNPTSKTCECNNGFHANRNTQTCIRSKRVGEECEDHSSCATSDEQEDKVECRPDTDRRRKCFCKSGYSTAGNACVREGDGGASSMTFSVSCFVACLIAYWRFS